MAVLKLGLLMFEHFICHPYTRHFKLSSNNLTGVIMFVKISKMRL